MLSNLLKIYQMQMLIFNVNLFEVKWSHQLRKATILLEIIMRNNGFCVYNERLAMHHQCGLFLITARTFCSGNMNTSALKVWKRVLFTHDSTPLDVLFQVLILNCSLG